MNKRAKKGMRVSKKALLKKYLKKMSAIRTVCLCEKVRNFECKSSLFIIFSFEQALEGSLCR